MAYFTHQYFNNTPAEVNPASGYISEVIVCRNYVAHSSKTRGQIKSDEYHALKAQGFRFIAFVPDTQHRDIIMVKVNRDTLEINKQYYGIKLSAARLIKLKNTENLYHFQVGYDWGITNPDVIVGRVRHDDLAKHLAAIASDADRADVLEWLRNFALTGY